MSSSSNFIIKNDDTLWSCGYNTYGQLGVGSGSKFIFTDTSMTDVKSIYDGVSYTFILKNDGTLWATGRNNDGQLGLGDTASRTTFSKVDIDDIKFVYTSRYYYTYALKNDGTLWVCGNNEYGQLGLGDTTSRNIFTKADISNVDSIYATPYSIYALKTDGTLWSSGYNNYGELGLGHKNTVYAFTKVNIDDVKSVYMSESSTYVLKNDGTLWTCGRNNYGQLGLGHKNDTSTLTKVNIDDIKSVYNDRNYSVYVLKNDGTLWGCGQNSFGQLGLGDFVDKTIFTKIDISDIAYIYIGMYYIFILKNDGTLCSCGYNSNGQLGLGDKTNKSTFTKVDMNDIRSVYVCDYSVYIIKNDDTLWSCGSNAHGKLGLGDTTDRSTFTYCTDNVHSIDASTNSYNIFIVKNDDTLWSCGHNYYGGLGLGNNTTPILNLTKVDIGNIKSINNVRILYIEKPLFELINIKPISNISISNNRVLLKLDTRCKVFKYKFKSKVSIYHSLENIDIDSELSAYTYDNEYQAGIGICENPYITKYILLVFNNTVDTDFEIWAEYDNGNISIGKISNSQLSTITRDITNNLYIDENKNMYINNMDGNYNRIRTIMTDILFEGSINTVSDNILGDLTQYKMFNIILSNGNNSISSIVLELGTNITILDGVNNITINMDSTSLHVISINGLTITSIIGIK